MLELVDYSTDSSADPAKIGVGCYRKDLIIYAYLGGLIFSLRSSKNVELFII